MECWGETSVHCDKVRAQVLAIVGLEDRQHLQPRPVSTAQGSKRGTNASVRLVTISSELCDEVHLSLGHSASLVWQGRLRLPPS